MNLPYGHKIRYLQVHAYLQLPHEGGG